MSDDPRDLELDTFNAERRSEPPLVLSSPRREYTTLAIVIAVLALALVGGYFYLYRTPTKAPAAATAKTAAPASSASKAEPGEQIPLPPLDQTDPLVRQLVSQLSSHPATMAWLTTEGLIQNFVVVASRIADGESPAIELKKVGPISPFRVRGTEDSLHMDPRNYGRYDRYAAAVEALDARGAARLYGTLKPRVTDAYGRLGHQGADFDPVLERAIVDLLKVPVVRGDIALEPHGIGYAYADERLEKLTSAQKQLLRMGPDNVRSVKAKLREIAGHLGIPESRLPSPSARCRAAWCPPWGRTCSAGARPANASTRSTDRDGARND
jgi:hypothetical protein